MKVLIIFALLGSALTAPRISFGLRQAKPCDEAACKLPDCKCWNSGIPGGFKTNEVPQFVYFTFDDALSTINIDYYRNAFFGKKNPDGCPVQATYYVSHEYSDYSLVNEVYKQGHEIALHSITHKPSTDYWRTLSTEELVAEFGGERELISKFANIPISSIKGMRLPLLQLSGNNSYLAGKESGLTYDCSWPTGGTDNWPYTLDYLSEQQCPIPPCPTTSIPGFWVQPMINLIDGRYSCSMVDACAMIEDDVDYIFEFFKKNFERTYKNNRAPIGFYLHAAWFGRLPEHSFEAYVKFVDYLQTLDDVYLVSVERALEWVRHPVKLGEKLWPDCPKVEDAPCVAHSCQLRKEQEERYMTICGSSCPKVYPWLGNPLGQ